MGYLLDQMEKLAKESERSFGENLAIGASAAGAGAGATAGMKLLSARELGKEMLARDLTGRVGPRLIGDGKPLSATMTGIRGIRNMRQAQRQLAEQYMKQGDSLLTAANKSTKMVLGALPKKVKLLAALGLPVGAAAAYGGYKAADSVIG